jgi:hypothetical protein
MRALVAYMIENGETLESAIAVAMEIIKPAAKKVLRRKVIEAYCENTNPAKKTKVFDADQVVVSHDYTPRLSYPQDTTTTNP